MVQSPQNSPQICGHWRWSPQFKKGILAFPHWMASRSRSSRFQGETRYNWFVWFRQRSHCQISSKVKLYFLLFTHWRMWLQKCSFNCRYLWYLVAISAFIVPMTILNYLVPGISWFDLYCLNYTWYLHNLHFTFLVNSAAHMWGYRPYEKLIDNLSEYELLFYLPCLIYLSFYLFIYLSAIPGEFIRVRINLFQCWLLVKVRKIRMLNYFNVQNCWINNF